MDLPVIDCKVSTGKIKLLSSHKYPKARFQPELERIQNLYPDHAVWHRSMKSLCREWACHNAAYEVGFKREKTADCDLDYPQTWYIRFLYWVAGAFVWSFIT